MLWSRDFVPTLKETPQEAECVSHKLMLRAGLVRMLMSGAYSYLPMGLRVLDNIQRIIRQEMNACGASELLLPALQPLELWQKTGRDQDIGEVMFRFNDRRGRKLCLGPTHEEVITDLVKNHISSYKQLPLVLYQIQTKFRDEVRPRFGLVRACEFIMKDAYSFDVDEAGLDKNYQAMYEAYQRIFKRCGLNILITEADSGIMGGKVSHEFMVPAENGEDIVLRCPKCKKAHTAKDPNERICASCQATLEKINCIEVGHIFKLGTKYTASLNGNFLDAKGKLSPIMMGCYGIGVSRLISAIIEQNNDKDGIVWPREVAPYQVIILPLDVGDGRIMSEAFVAYQELQEKGIDVLLDDRDERAGFKFKDADLLGIPVQIIVGREFLEQGSLDLKLRREAKRVKCPSSQIYNETMRLLNG
ncbi:MAG: proline--tRNA ligase [Candidatus Omnitrophica bacterium]|nr:proline--tRNA ligase [Candidatus Omnitrophota bacterium]